MAHHFVLFTFSGSTKLGDSSETYHRRTTGEGLVAVLVLVLDLVLTSLSMIDKLRFEARSDISLLDLRRFEPTFEEVNRGREDDQLHLDTTSREP